MAEYLAALDENAEPDPNRKEPKVISPSDPSSAWTAKANKRVQFGYGLNYLIDIDEAVIVDVEATPARTYDEVAATKTMLDRTEACFGLKPKGLAADTAYGTGKFLGWLVKEKKIAPHIPVWERPKREDGIFSTSDFRWDGRHGVYICPAGKQLRTSGTVHSDGRQRYRARKRDCDACPLRPQCCPKEFAALCGARRSRRCSRCGATQDEDQGVPQITRSAQARRDALRAPEDAPWLRAPAAQRSLRRSRRVPSRRNRAEPQDAGPAPHPAAATICMRVSCVASVSGVSVEADALLGRGQKNPSALHLPDQHTSPSPNRSRRRLFRQHRSNSVRRPL